MSGAKRGRLEAQMTVPAGGWGFELDDGVAPTAGSIPAGEYYLEDLLLQLKFALQTASQVGATYTVTASTGEGGTGRVTISSTAASFFLDLSISDALPVAIGWPAGGFVVDVSGAPQLSPGQPAMLWMPDVPKITPYGDGDSGTDRSDARSTQNGSMVRTIYGKRWRVVEPGEIRWVGVTHPRTRIAEESIANESFEAFWRNAILGEGPGGQPGGPIRLYWDADGASYATYAVLDPTQSRPQQLRQSWTGAWIVELPRMVVQ